MRSEVSAIDVTAKTFFERLYLVLGLRQFAPWVNCPWAPTPPPFTQQLHLDFRANFSALNFVSIIYQVDRKKPPPPGGFPIYYIPSSRTVCKRTSLAWFVFFEGGPFTHGSCWGKIVNRKPPRGGGFLSIKVILPVPSLFPAKFNPTLVHSGASPLCAIRHW